MENIFLLNKAIWRQLTSLTPQARAAVGPITSLGYQWKNSIGAKQL